MRTQHHAQKGRENKKCKYTARYSLVWKESSIFALSNTPRCRKTCLAKDERAVLRHVAEKGGEGPWELPMLQVKCALFRLQDEGLIYCIVNFDEAVDARLTLCGSYYIEQNPKLKNPILWDCILDFITENKERICLFLIILYSIITIALVIKIIAMCLSN